MEAEATKIRSWVLRVASRAPGGSMNRKMREGLYLFFVFFFGKVSYLVPFWAPVDFDGGPKITFLHIMLIKSD